jgi:hypothetical protein
MEVQPILHLSNFDNCLPPDSAQQRRVYLNMLQQMRAREQSQRRSVLQGRGRVDSERPQIHSSYLSRREERNELRPWEVDCNQIDFI